MATEGKVQYRINVVTAIFMLAYTIIIDGLQFLLTLSGFLIPISLLLTFFTITTLFVWFAILGINYFSGRKSARNLITMGSSLIIELVPIINALPAASLSVAIIIYNSRKEDRENFNAKGDTVIPKNVPGQRILPSK